MRVQTPKDLAAAARRCRKRRGWSQAQLAEEAGVGRDWVIQFEKGKASVELGFVLRVLETLGLPLRVDAEAATDLEPATEEGAIIPREAPPSLEHEHQLPTNLL